MLAVQEAKAPAATLGMKSNVDTVSEEDLGLAEVSGTLSHQVMGMLSHQLVSSRCLLWSEQAPPPFDASGLRSLIVAVMQLLEHYPLLYKRLLSDIFSVQNL